MITQRNKLWRISSSKNSADEPIVGSNPTASIKLEINVIKTLIKNTEIHIGDKIVRYYPYYFGIEEYERDHRLCVKDVLSQWATALRKLGSGYGVLHLPYSLDDESCLCFRATLAEGKVSLRCVQVSANGYAMSLNDLTADMTAEYKYLHQTPNDFGVYEPDELIESLIQAEIEDE